MKIVLTLTALAGLGVLACGEDAPSTGKDEDEATEETSRNEKDAGKATSKDAGKRDARAEEEEDDEDDDGESCTGRQARECDDCDNAPCGQVCMGGSWSECRSVQDTVSDLLDGGGITGLIPEGGIRAYEGGVSVTLGDASINVPTMDCPAPLECASKGMGVAGMFISQAIMGASFCATADMIGLPPACTAQADCAMAGLPSGMCRPLGPLGSYCLQLCQ